MKANKKHVYLDIFNTFYLVRKFINIEKYARREVEHITLITYFKQQIFCKVKIHISRWIHLIVHQMFIGQLAQLLARLHPQLVHR